MEHATNPEMKAWAAFCKQLEKAGAQILRDDAPDDLVTRAEGWRYLTRLTRAAFEWFIEYDDPTFPVLFRPAHETLKFGMDNPDSYYQKCMLRGDLTYRITGRRNTIDYLSFTTSKGNYATSGTQLKTGFIDSTTLQVELGGHFEIVLSSQQQPGNWLPMDPESESLLIRQNFKDRTREAPADLIIERLESDASPAPLAATFISGALQRAAGFLERTPKLFADWAAAYAAHINELPPMDQRGPQSVGGDPNIYYHMSRWELNADQALIIDIERVPPCLGWNFQLANFWMESLDYRYRPVHLNQYTATANADSSVRIVVADRNPGHPNWLSTDHHRCGTMCLRWIGAEELVHPKTRVVSLAEVAGLN